MRIFQPIGIVLLVQNIIQSVFVAAKQIFNQKQSNVNARTVKFVDVNAKEKHVINFMVHRIQMLTDFKTSDIPDKTPEILPDNF